MSSPTAHELTQKHCRPCEGGIPALSGAEALDWAGRVPRWQITADGTRIRREWTAKNFMAAIEFFNKVAALAEREGHHPDLHLEGYRNVVVELWTHAVGGISENDFILAAKIDELPIAVKA